MIKRITLLSYLLLLCPTLFAQREMNPENFRKGRYIDLALALSAGSQKDQVVSPLYYNTLMGGINISSSWYSEKSAFEVNFHGLMGESTREFDDVTYDGIASNVILEIKCNHIIKSPSEGVRFLPGLSLDSRTGFNVNYHLQNAALTVDMIYALSANFGVEIGYTKPGKRAKLLWLIPYTRKRSDYSLFANIKLPMVACYYRPEYTNPGNITILKDDLPFAGYKTKWAGPIGLQTELGFAKILPNGNRIKYGYTWNALTVGQRSINRYHEANHLFTIGLVFKMK